MVEERIYSDDGYRDDAVYCIHVYTAYIQCTCIYKYHDGIHVG